MIDALLYAVRDTIRGAGINYGRAEVEIMDDGRPPPRAGNVFVSVHSGTLSSSGDNQLLEEYGFTVTLTMRAGNVAIDRVGDQLIARNVPLEPLGYRQGFNHKAEQLRALLHMNWQMTVTTGEEPKSANDNLSEWATGDVYGFVEPARFRGMQAPKMVGGEWFGAEPDEESFGLMADLRFEGAKRMQPYVQAGGLFV